MVIFVQSAEAREHHHGHRHHHSVVASGGASVEARPTPNGLFAFAAMNVQSSATAYRARDRARPVAWCGWEMRRLVGADPGPSFNLARNWAHWAGRDRRESARLWCGRTMSGRSSVSTMESGLSNLATTVTHFAAALARLWVRLRSGGVDWPRRFHFSKAKGRPDHGRPIF
jgi:hypothetical protein